MTFRDLIVYVRITNDKIKTVKSFWRQWTILNPVLFLEQTRTFIMVTNAQFRPIHTPFAYSSRRRVPIRSSNNIFLSVTMAVRASSGRCHSESLRAALSPPLNTRHVEPKASYPTVSVQLTSTRIHAHMPWPEAAVWMLLLQFLEDLRTKN